jgi:hypothetical protein
MKVSGTIVLLAASGLVFLSGCSSPAPSLASSPAPATPSASSTSHGPLTSGALPAGAFTAALDEGRQLIGLTEAQAQERATADGFPFQVVERNGAPRLTPLNLVTNRIDVKVVDGVVTEASAG